MNARSEGDETPLWLDAHACQEARRKTGRHRLEVSRKRTSNAPGGRAGIAVHYVEGPQRTRPQDARVLPSHSEWIVVRSRAFMDNPG